MLVSILVLVDAALRPGEIIQIKRDITMRVSILVLVDAALRQHLIPATLGTILCFNPCFSGCRPATLEITGTQEEPIMFQSLF